MSLFIGGVAAVLLELAEPSVRTGVWEHSSFRQDPFGRLHRTGFAAMVTVYAPRAQAEAMIAKVVRMHDKVRGHTSEGQSYYANDPRLLNWVQATAVFGFTEAYDQWVQALPRSAKDQAFQEAQTSAQLYGATGLPTSWKGWEDMLRSQSPLLQAHPIMAEFLSIMCEADILPRPLRWVQKLWVKAAIDITPQPVRDMPQLQAWHMHWWERAIVKVMARAAYWLPLPQLPPALAKNRMQ